MFQFFVEPGQITAQEAEITGGDVNHIRNVLRMKAGEQVRISDQQGQDFLCRIEKLEESRILLRIQEKCQGTEPPIKITLFQGLPKGDKMELIIQKAVELGVYEIIPVACKRAVVKLDGKKAAAKTARWQGIAEAAAKQSRRGIIPRVKEVMSFQEAVAYSGCASVRMIPYELAQGMDRTKELINSLRPGEDIAVFIGPEGGFSGEEIQQAVCAGINPVTLGKRILRTETAGMTVLSIIMYHLEN